MLFFHGVFIHGVFVFHGVFFHGVFFFHDLVDSLFSLVDNVFCGVGSRLRSIFNGGSTCCRHKSERQEHAKDHEEFLHFGPSKGLVTAHQIDMPLVQPDKLAASR